MSNLILFLSKYKVFSITIIKEFKSNKINAVSTENFIWVSYKFDESENHITCILKQL